MFRYSGNKKSIRENRLGFTLIELSIVLVIIGLLVGGILVGRDLIKASEIRAQISQIEEFKTAANTFRVKYDYLPGDMPPNQASQLGFFTFTGTYAGLVCGGNGFGNNDGLINWRGLQGEMYVFWAHLSSAGMIKGGYGNVPSKPLKAAASTCGFVADVGVPTGGATSETEFSLFVPRAKIMSSGAYIFVTGNDYYAPANGIFKYYNNTNKLNIFAISGPVIGVTSGGYTTSASQSYQIDSKVDDGLPTSGSVRLYNTSTQIFGGIMESAPCTTTGVIPIQYDLSPSTVDKINCAVDFLW